MQIWADQSPGTRGISRAIGLEGDAGSTGILNILNERIESAVGGASWVAQQDIETAYGGSEQELAHQKLRESYVDRVTEELKAYAEIAVYGVVKTEGLPALGKWKQKFPGPIRRMGALIKLGDKTKEVEQILSHWSERKVRNKNASVAEDGVRYVDLNGNEVTPDFFYEGYDNIKVYEPLYSRYKTLWNAFAGKNAKHEHEVYEMGKEPGIPGADLEVAFPDVQVAVVKLPEVPDFLEVGVNMIEGNPGSPLGARWGYVQDAALREVDAALGDHC